MTRRRLDTHGTSIADVDFQLLDLLLRSEMRLPKELDVADKWQFRGEEIRLALNDPLHGCFLIKADVQPCHRFWRRFAKQFPVRCVRRVHRGVFVDEQDEPVAGLPMELQSVKWNGQNWTFTTAAPASSTEPRSLGRIADAIALPILRTDQWGNYSIAVYTGSTAEFQVVWSDSNDLGTQERHVWRRDKRAPAKDLKDLSKLKQVTLNFEDEQRQPVESIRLDRVEMYAGDEVVSRSAGGVRDVFGLHLFVDSAVDRIDLRTRDLASSRSTAASCSRWKPRFRFPVRTIRAFVLHSLKRFGSGRYRAACSILKDTRWLAQGSRCSRPPANRWMRVAAAALISASPRHPTRRANFSSLQRRMTAASK
jgi:hypothetical protein